MSIKEDAALRLLQIYWGDAVWRRALFVAIPCLDWIEELAPEAKDWVAQKRKEISDFVEDNKEYAFQLEEGCKLDEKERKLDSGEKRIAVGFYSPKHQDVFTGIDKVLYEIILGKKDLDRFVPFGCGGSEADYSGQSFWYPS